MKHHGDRPFFAMPYPGIFRVTSPLPFPGLDHVHVYIAEGPSGGLVVIDTTLGILDSFDRIEQGIRWLDRKLTDIERIILTHAHPDHIGLAAALQDASGAEVVCHPICHEMMLGMRTPERWEHIGRSYAAHGWTPTPEAIRGGGFPIPPNVVHVREGERLHFAGTAWDVHWTPGHEWGHIVFFRPGDRLLIAGDTLLAKITPHIGYMVDPPDPLGMFLESLKHIEALEAAFVLPMHGRPFEEATERARAIAAHHQQRLRRIVDIFVRRGAVPAIDVSEELFGRNLMHFEERLALAETLSHLEHLRLAGRLRRELQDGVYRYELDRPVG